MTPAQRRVMVLIVAAILAGMAAAWMTRDLLLVKQSAVRPVIPD